MVVPSSGQVPQELGAFIFSGGEPVNPEIVALIPKNSSIIGADSGVKHALDLGFTVAIAVGDFDSLAPEILAQITAAGTKIEMHPPDKDATDLELALDTAVRHGAKSITIIGGHGGRLDHFLANAQLLGAKKFAATKIEAWFDTTRVTAIHDQAQVTGYPGAIISLITVGPPATGVTTTGLRFALEDAEIVAGATLGVSNEFISSRATVVIKTGTILAVQPDGLI